MLKKLKALWKSIWIELKDWKTLILFFIVCGVVSVEVWLPYTFAFIVGADTELGIWLIGIGSTCWLFWLAPFTPFIPLCIGITFGLKKLIRHFSNKRKAKNKKPNIAEFQDSVLDYID